MPEKAKVSIVITCYNYAHFLEDAVGSVINQTYRNWECLIVDDGSTDNTKEVASKLIEKDSRVKYYHHNNIGLAASRNRGFAFSKGDYIQFLDADDMIHPHKLQEQVKILDDDPTIGVSYTSYQTFKGDLANLTGKYSYLNLTENPIEDFLFKWERGLSIPIHAAVFRRSVLDKYDKQFSEELRAKEDWLLWVTLAVDRIIFHFLDKDFCYYRQHDHNQTLDIKEMSSYFIRASLIIIDRIPIEYKEKFIFNTIQHIEIEYLRRIELNIIKSTVLYKNLDKIGLIKIIKKILIAKKRILVKLGYIAKIRAHRKIRKKIGALNLFDSNEIVFSVIIPIYDRVDQLKEAIDGVLNQSFKNYELILVCDGSPKATLNIVESYRSNNQVIIYKYMNRSGNACRGRNKGIELARGKIIAFLDSDDLCSKNRLYHSLFYMLDKNVDVVYGRFKYIVDGSRIIDGATDGLIPNVQKFNFANLKKANYICASSVSVKKACLTLFGGFRPEMKYREDHELWLRLAYNGCKFYGINELLTSYRVHSKNLELDFIENDAHWENLMHEMYKKPYQIS